MAPVGAMAEVTRGEAAVTLACVAGTGTERRSVLVLGMGAEAYGREQRAVTMLGGMPRVRAHFLVSKWGDGSVRRLLAQHGLEFSVAPFGYVGPAHPWWTMVSLAHLPKALCVVVRAYRRERASAIVLLEMKSIVSALPAILLLRATRGARLVFYLGDVPGKYGFTRLLARLVRCLADDVIVNSDAVRSGLAAIGLDPARIKVVYNGKRLERFNAASGVDFREVHGWPDTTAVVGYVGQVSMKKGANDFVDVANHLLAEGHDCGFVLVGRPPGADPCQRRIAEGLKGSGWAKRIVFAGWIDAIERAYAGFDILVVPSRFEDALPNVAIEAMAAGVPIVAYRVGGIGEIVVNGETGFLVEPASLAMLAERVARLVGDASLRARMGAAGRRRARERFDLEKSTRALEQVLLR